MATRQPPGAAVGPRLPPGNRGSAGREETGKFPADSARSGPFLAAFRLMGTRKPPALLTNADKFMCNSAVGPNKCTFWSCWLAAPVLESQHRLSPANCTPWVAGCGHGQEEAAMIWTKPEFKEVAVTLEVTAYTARR